MKYKRKSNAPSVRSPVFIWFLVFLLGVLAFGIVYAWGNNRKQCLGREVKKLEVELEKVKKVHASEMFKWQNMKTSANIENMLAKHQINMGWPDESNIVRVRPSKAQDASSEMFEGRLASGARTSRGKGEKP